MSPALDRADVLAQILGDGSEFALIGGLGNPILDLAKLTNNAPAYFPLDGVMGAAVSTGLGLALSRPDLQVVVVTGDGELLMNVGALATVAVHDPGNLKVICLDNGRYGVTGGQVSHTGLRTDLAEMAIGAGMLQSTTCHTEADLADAAAVIRTREHASLVVVKVGPATSAPYPVDRDGSACRVRFREAVSVRR